MSGANVSSPDEIERDPARRRLLMVALAAAAVLMPLNSTMIAVVMPQISLHHGIDAATATLWLVTAYLVVSIVVLVPAGRIADRIGYGRAFAIGQTLFAIGALCAGLAPDFATLVVGRLLISAGGAFVIPTTMALVRLIAPPDRVAHALGAFGSLMAASAAIGPLVGGAIAEHWGWHAIFWANLPFLAVSVLCAGGAYRLRSAATASRFDLSGSLLLGLGLVTLVLAVPAPNGWRAGCIAGGVLVLAAFAWRERRAQAPVLDLALFRAPAFAAGSALVALHNLAMYSLMFELPHLLAPDGKRSLRLGLVLASLTGGMVVCGPLGGYVAARIGARATSVMASLLGVAGTLAVAAALAHGTAETYPLPVIAASLAVIGCGLGFAAGPSQAAALGTAPRERSGSAAGALSTMRYLGGLAGSAGLGIVLPMSGSGPWLGCIVYALAFGVAAAVALALPGRRPVTSA